MSDEVLKQIYEDQRRELDFRRAREQQIFTWSATVFLALIGGALVSPRRENLLARLESWQSAFASGAVVLLAVFCTLWLLHQRRQLRENQRILAALAVKRGWFEETATGSTEKLLPATWKDWGLPKQNPLSGLGKLIALPMLGFVAAFSVWLALR